MFVYQRLLCNTVRSEVGVVAFPDHFSPPFYTGAEEDLPHLYEMADGSGY